MPSYLIFEVGGVRAAVPAADVIEVIAVHAATAVPGAPPVLAGLLGHRGAVVPLIDGAEHVTGVPASAGRGATAILVATSFGTVGITVDRVLDFVHEDDVRGRRIDVESLAKECRAEIVPAGRTA